jgi:Flp pilus assembly protein TadD
VSILLLALASLVWAALSPQEFIDKVEALVRQGELSKAVATATKGVNKHPDSAPLYNALGTAFMMKGAHGEAIEAFESATSCDASYAPSYANLADALARVGQFEDAKREIDNSLGLRPDNAGFRVIKGEVLEGLGREALALAEYRSAAKLDPDLAAARFHLGMSAVKSGDKVAAHRELTRFLALEGAEDGFKDSRRLSRIAAAQAAVAKP